MADNSRTKKELEELAGEYRADWSQFDGRMFQSEVCCIADRIIENDRAVSELYKLGAEYRRDWSDVDGRMIASELYYVAGML